MKFARAIHLAIVAVCLLCLVDRAAAQTSRTLGLRPAQSAAAGWERRQFEVPDDEPVGDQAFETILDPGEEIVLEPVPGEVEMESHFLDPDAWEPPSECLHCEGDVGEGCAACGGHGHGWPGYRNTPWFVEADTVALKRGRPRERAITLDENVRGFQIISETEVISFPLAVMMNTAPRFDFQPGMRINLSRFLGRDMIDREHTVEFRYQGLFDWDARASVVASAAESVPDLARSVGTLSSPFPNAVLPPPENPAAPLQRPIVAGFQGAVQQDIEYGSDLHDFAVNYRLRRGLGRDRMVYNPDGAWEQRAATGFTPSFYAGYRHVRFDENFALVSQGLFFNQATFEFEDSAGDYRIETTNRLHGFQIGGDLMHENEKWSWGFRGNAGVYVNTARQTSRIIATSEFVPADPNLLVTGDASFSGRRTQASFVGEFGVVGSWQLRPNLRLRGAYDMMWIHGLALAGEQFDFSVPLLSNARVLSEGGLFFNGFSLGLEMFW